MSGWYWALWAVLTVLNAALWFYTTRNLHETRRLLKVATDA